MNFMLRRNGGQFQKFGFFIRCNSTESFYSKAILGLKKDLKQAMLAKDDLKKTTIRNMLSTIKNKEIDAKDTKFDEFTLFGIYSKLINQRKDSISDYLKNNREDLAGKEEQELKLIQTYLDSLPIASPQEIDTKVEKFLNDLKEKEGTVPMKDVFSKVDWNTLTKEWKASQSMIKSSIVSKYKNIF
ncbi:hypothetical protein Kpol_1059p31 [Vanderwaltozyma polyspora DSM 70294]|uniref:Altered inheritance of mitochondria protein 41, mitochondrial n=1 Tax=Vanderwaltozyma polyspora (strain ATCC 22028 / DSM 70294 / BCRC 21397 / CBS 2163 / NBRC 10782 / NRRL Y-8283 / UCD 57-17) TaxID=436907 RepID=AIM41_VANPO|nr:uncharacterized protein Kpol_1059p31 [Vanderwaltozyma polyspora DSM 70294]A7TN35.1 RecName: Full=Altered inheritance of mitochondria protein 41, mitochondrial; Flags: Precursor [Vanderwaltozyma polyspora DSM 70294]EDO16341.1 hypothetical protein Kpol_1059p31 [Vanderwaltozyma polyspora DSM 70294]